MPTDFRAYLEAERERLRERLSRKQSPRDATPSLEELERDWRRWTRTLFPQYTVHDFAPHHEELWAWGWNLKRGVRPHPFGAWWSRGHAKSTNGEMLCVACGARQTRKYILYVSRTQDQADDHVQNVGAMLESSAVESYYPDLAARLIGKHGNSKGWRRNRLRTNAGFTIDALGLDTAARGIKLDEMRPDLVIFDDIDIETDSLEATAKIIKILTRKLIPAGSEDVAILFLQNLVHKDSVASQLNDGRADFLRNIYNSGPHPAVRSLATEREGTRTTITGGEPTWAGFDLDRCQAMIDDMGLDAFLIECQHDTTLVVGEKDFREYDERYHVITWSEFARYYDEFGEQARTEEGEPRIPFRWNKGRGLDWGTTREHPTACVNCTRPSKVDSLSDCVFAYREIVMPEWTPASLQNKDYEVVSPGRVARSITEAEARHGEKITRALMSHEASAALATFLVDLPEEIRVFFTKWKARRGAGVPQVQEVMTIDRTREHPFRVYPQGHPQAGEPLMGRPRFFIIVADAQGELYVDGEGKLLVRQAVDHKGMIRLRAELPEYNQNRQPKIFDDAVNALCGLASSFFVHADPETEEESFEERLPETLRQRTIMQLPAAEAERAVASREFWTKKGTFDGEQHPTRSLSIGRFRRR
jgi:hypothetical protein